MIFESHAHYDDEQFKKDREAVIKKIKAAGVGCVINIGDNMDSSRKVLELARTYKDFYAVVGVHPQAVQEMKEDDLEILLAMTAFEKVVAIGEIGLDYHYDVGMKEVQKLWFRQQIRLAKSLGLPMVIHSRDATQDTFDLLLENQGEETGGVIHCFSGSVETAKRYVDLGYYIGIGGVVTFEKADRLKEVVKAIPLEHLLIETDAPYLAPTPYRGKRNDSSYLPYIIQAIGAIKGVSAELVEEATWNNGQRLFKL